MLLHAKDLLMSYACVDEAPAGGEHVKILVSPVQARA